MAQGDDRIVVPDGEAWAALRVALQNQFGEHIFWLYITEDQNELVVDGEVASEDAKSAIADVLEREASGKTFTNQILVTSPFYPANQAHFDDLDTGDDDASSGVNVVRYPQISCEHELIAGKSYVFEVDLAVSPDDETQGGPLTLTDVDPEWTLLEVEAEFSSFDLDIEPQDARRPIILYKDGTSKAARFAARVKTEAGSSGIVNVAVAFENGGRVRGFAKRQFDARVAVTKSSPQQRSASPTVGNFSHDAAPAPELTIKISHDQKELGRCTWSFVAPGYRDMAEVNAMPEMNLGVTAKQYFDDNFALIRTLTDGRHIGSLRGIGDKIWAAAPPEFHRLYLAMVERSGPSFPIQIFTNEPHVPWELMFPRDPRRDNLDHLCMSHPIARWTMSAGLVSTIPNGGIASFVPDYLEGALPAAMREGEWLCSEFGATALEATFNGFTGCLTSPASEPISILHFAGHGAGDQADPRQRGLRMSDGWVPVEEINSSVKLGNRDRSLVVLNACHAGTQTNVLGAVHGWPGAFIEVGFGAVIAPLWAVQDQTACAVMKSAITSLRRDGDTFGSAMTNARKEHRATSAAAFSYVLHGDVMTTMAV